MGMDSSLEISDDRSLMDTNANLAFCYPPPPTLHAPEIPPVLRYMIPFLANLLHQNLTSFHQAAIQAGVHISNTAR
ncbi:hypothetical protein AAC387_Pa09g0493 [Persea americana]